NFTDAQFLRVGNDLVIKAFGTDDSVTFKNYLSDSDSYSRDFNFIFADKTASTTELTSLTIQLNGTDGNDVLNGWKGNDINYSATKLLILNNQTNVNSLNDLIKADVFIV
ncbi:hypothetical protein ACN4J7_003657, partial [Acinetobacter baumannii]|nr:hypothetical protein [Acinetobacter baumannii]EKW6926890.1 hypothetical protein [Acinetobacter baumannii]ELB2645796.1 hypothetical protein [Acinetobacter baumannii]ELU2203100.1 hypothetical protein [Acinetobacter baumannii]ELZ3581479.1 hypothetical protein [Acinetobacter baumannii]